MATGIPIIASDSGGTKDIIVNKETGLLVKEKSPEELFQAIKLIVEDQRLRNRIIINSLKCSQKNTWEKVANTLLQHYMTLVPRKKIK